MKAITAKLFFVFLFCPCSSFNLGENFFSEYDDYKSGFNNKNNGGNTKNVDTIFNLLADIEHRDVRNNYYSPLKQEIRKLEADSEHNTTPVGQSKEQYVEDEVHSEETQIESVQDELKSGEQSVRYELKSDEKPAQNKAKSDEPSIQNEINTNIIPKATKHDPSTLKHYVKLLKAVSKATVGESETVETFLKTVDKVTTIYEDKKQKVIRNRNTSLEEGTDPRETEGVLKSTTRVISYLLDPPNVERVFDISRKTTDEDEILEQLSDIILGAEERGGGHGYGITLDPVTCIALLTLAAYLIRAVFQILLLTTAAPAILRGEGRKRSSNYGPLAFPLEWSDMPEMVAGIHDSISGPSFHYEGREKREEREERMPSSLTRVPSELALLFKLKMDGQVNCLRKLTCYHLVGKSVFDFGVSEMFWSAMTVYDGDSDVMKYLSRRPGNTASDTCENESPTCNELNQVDCTPCTPQKLNDYLRIQTLVNKLVEEFVHRWDW